MITVRGFESQNVAVIGLGRSGLSAARALAAGHANVLAWDDSAQRRQEAEQAGFPPADPATLDWGRLAALVLSPGIPLTHPAPYPVIRRARQARVPVIGDVELFARSIGHATGAASKIVTITGTNGKSTTTALIGHVLSERASPVEVVGNIGRPVLDSAELGPDGFYVLELSSYQIDLLQTLRADIAVLLNITPDHLDRHGGMAGYVAAKARLFELQDPNGAAVIGIDDEPCREIAGRLEAEGRNVIRVSVGRKLERGVSIVDGRLFEDGVPSGDLSRLRTLRGAHNWQNAGCAFAAARLVGIAPDAILSAFATFPGLAHRMEQIAVLGGVAFVNDSKATNAEAAARALACFENVFLILGGQAKEGGIEALKPLLARVRKSYLIGSSAKAFAASLDGLVPYTIAEALDPATRFAAADAWAAKLPGAVVLLSPACASFDQFRDFEDRGEHFRAVVASLARDCEAGGRA